LFSLALSEVLLLNLWTTDVGRFEGANYGLLKTVFDLNLQLFTKETGGYPLFYSIFKKFNFIFFVFFFCDFLLNFVSTKTLLLFVLRDHDPEETPLEALARTLRHDMTQLWADIKKVFF